MFLHNSDFTHHKRIERFLEAELPLQVLAHLEFPHRTQKTLADECFTRWIRKIQDSHRTQIGYITGYERNKDISLHIHSVLVTPAPLDINLVRDSWLSLVGFQHQKCAVVEAYQFGKGGLSYSIKAENEDQCDIQYSNNLHLFRRSISPAEITQLNCKDRRRLSRIQNHPTLGFGISTSEKQFRISAPRIR